MKLDKLVKRLRREATANPKKAGILGVLAVVAIYFWAPLVMGWCTKKDAAGTPPIAVAEATSGQAAIVQTSGQVAKAAPEAVAELSWRQLRDANENDLRCKPGRPLPQSRDPFAVVAGKPTEVREEKEDAIRAVPPPTPQMLGLVLGGTVVGGGRRVARLAGKNFAEGQTIEVTKDGRAWRFTLLRVDARSVVLSRDGEEFELSLPKPARGGSIELTGLEK